MDVIQMRNAILKAYSSRSWIVKVAGMSEKQIVAVYFSFKKRGLI